MMSNLEKRREKEVGSTGEEEGSDSYLTVNRWPQQETLALLNITSQMDGLFRWDDVSRRMAELGYDRSAKKCEEKFKNIYKYHKRLKNSSYDRSNGKSYRFFDQLEALEQQGKTAMKGNTNFGINPNKVPLFAMPLDSDSTLNTTSTPSVSSSGSEYEDDQKKKRKWEDFSEKLMRCVLQKQEDMQKKFLEAIDKFERERLAREQEWRMQEMARIKREHELLMQERSLSAAKDAAILAFLQKICDQGKPKPAHAAQQPTEESPPFLQKISDQGKPIHAVQMHKEENPSQDLRTICMNEKVLGENSSSRWPKQEVEALITIRSKLDFECERSGTKGPSWQDVSTAMKTIGYDRNAKRCKEKWENINKYYRRVRDSNKERRIDSKTCPYFHLLDDLYCKRTERLDNNSSDTCVGNLKPEEILMHMMNREQLSDHGQIPIANDREVGE